MSSINYPKEYQITLQLSGPPDSTIEEVRKIIKRVLLPAKILKIEDKTAGSVVYY